MRGSSCRRHRTGRSVGATATDSTSMPTGASARRSVRRPSTVSELDGGVVHQRRRSTTPPARTMIRTSGVARRHTPRRARAPPGRRRQRAPCCYVPTPPSGAEAAAGRGRRHRHRTRPWPPLAGVGADGVDSSCSRRAGDPGDGSTSLQAYDPATLDGAGAVTSPCRRRRSFASDAGRRAHVDRRVDGSPATPATTVVPGEYRWARPVS